MKIHYLFITLCLLSACRNKPATRTTTSAVALDSLPKPVPEAVEEPEKLVVPQGTFQRMHGNHRTGELQVYRDTDSTALVHMELTRGAPSYNMGWVYERIAWNEQGGILAMKDAGGNTECQMEFRITGQGITVTVGQNECGFGYGVRAGGHYGQVSNTQPEFFYTGEGRKVYFKDWVPEESYQSQHRDDIGFELMEKESFGPLQLGMGSATVLELLGIPEEKTPEVFAGADGGYHSRWHYPTLGLELGMVRLPELKGTEYNKLHLNSMTMTAPAPYKTVRKIGIGAHVEQVYEHYRVALQGVAMDHDFLVAGTVYGGLMFSFENDSVVSIFLGAAAE